MGDAAKKLEPLLETARDEGEFKYIPIPIANFMGGKNTSADIFIRLSNGKFICLAKKGQPFTLDRLSNYQDHHVTHLYFHPKQYGDYVENCLELSKLVSISANTSGSQRTQILAKTCEIVLSELSQMKLDSVSFGHAAAVCENILSIFDGRPQLTGIIKQLDGLGEDFAKHSLAVSIISLMLAQKLGWKGEKSQHTLSMAGLLHDIGMKEVPPEILAKPRADWTREEVQIYESHPDRGRDILISVPDLPVEIITIIHQHHEVPGKRGFPQKLPRDRIYPLSRVVALADLVSHLIVKTSIRPEPKTMDAAFLYLQTLHQSSFDPLLWEALKKCIENKPSSP